MYLVPERTVVQTIIMKIIKWNKGPRSLQEVSVNWTRILFRESYHRKPGWKRNATLTSFLLQEFFWGKLRDSIVSDIYKNLRISDCSPQSSHNSLYMSSSLRVISSRRKKERKKEIRVSFYGFQTAVNRTRDFISAPFRY